MTSQKYHEEFSKCYEEGVRDAMRDRSGRRYPKDSYAHRWWLRGFIYGRLLGDRISEGEFDVPKYDRPDSSHKNTTD
jgi:hypothetical protein